MSIVSPIEYTIQQKRGNYVDNLMIASQLWLHILLISPNFH
uniref:Uncharacterized protein n=1 Tax=Arundo donax TaxID=35708 RepID=A0A0A9FX98_ARUDO